MNRLATVKNLPSALDLQQSVQQLQTLMHEMRQEVDQSRQQIASLHSDLASLPLAVAKELSDLGRLSETLDVALRAQRQALSQTAKQMAEASVAQLDSIAASTNAQ